MATPVTSYNYADFMGGLLRANANAMICVVGDSKSTDSSTDSNLPYGLQLGFRSDAPIVARAGRAGNLNSGVYYSTTNTTAGGSITQATIQSQQSSAGQQCPTVLTGGIAAGAISATNQNPFPVPGCCVIYTGNQSWSATTGDWKAILNNLSGYRGGDWTSGNSIMARVVYYKCSQGITTNRLRTTRTTTVNTVTVDMSGSGTVGYTDIDCGSGSGAPDVRMIPDGVVSPDVDETGKAAFIGGVVFYRHTSGTPTRGIGIMDCALGGHTTESLLASLGGGASPTSPSARVIEWFDAMRVGKPLYFVVDIGQNAATNETTELNAGTQTTYKANVKAIVARLRAIHPGCKILLLNPYHTAYTATNNETKGAALLALAKETQCSYLDLYQIVGRTVSGNNPLTTDGIHWTVNGSQMGGYLLGAVGAEALASAASGSSRPARSWRGR